MKYLKQLLLALLVIVSTLSSCKKNELNKEEDKPKFDINNPVGYFIYGKRSNDNGSLTALLFEFGPAKTVWQYSATTQNNGKQTYAYEVIDDHILVIKADIDYRFVIENDQVTNEQTPGPYNKLSALALMKASESNLLAGKTFTGTYYKHGGIVLHQNFYYSFSASGGKVDVGFKPETIIRTENYSSIGNIAALIDVAGNNDVEFMVLINGKLETAYAQKTPSDRYYGDFSQQ